LLRIGLCEVAEPQDRTDLQALEAAYDACAREARELVSGLGEALGVWRAEPGSWSVAERLDHLATANRVYLGAMRPAAERAVRDGPADVDDQPGRDSSAACSSARSSRPCALVAA
jgi:DinB superfamily